MKWTGCAAAILAAVLAGPAAGRAAAAGGRELAVAAVQFHVDAQSLRSAGAYENALWRAAAAAVRGRRVDLIVFPEYAAAFFALADSGELLARSPTAAALLAALQAAEPSIRTPADFFASRANRAEGWIRESFGALAREHRAWVLAGTWLAPDGAGGLRNRALVFSPDGALAYTQDKVFLTEIEEQLLSTSPGDMEAAGGWRLGDWQVRLTICRDTFERAWETRHRGADLWIDIKANGAAFTEEERLSFARALPQRLGPAGVPYGLTVCLTGSFLEFLWEGESSFIAAAAGTVTTLAVTGSASAADSLLVRIPRPRRPLQAGEDR